MAKRTVIAVVVVFIAWAILDFIIHGIILQSTYEATASLWRPANEMNMAHMYLVSLLFIVFFVLIYALLVEKKSLGSGIKYGILFGLGTGISMGFGSYCFMPIPLTLAWTWFFGAWIKATASGAIVGAILKS